MSQGGGVLVSLGRPDKEGRIPAFKMIVGSLPKWVVAMKAVDGLVRAFHSNVTELLNILVDSCSLCCLPLPYMWALSCITLGIVNMLYTRGWSLPSCILTLYVVIGILSRFSRHGLDPGIHLVISMFLIFAPRFSRAPSLF